MRVPPQPFLLAGAAGLGAGLWGGLLRAGLAAPGGGSGWGLAHGPLMACGFLGTVISVERATALGRPVAWLVPAITALGTLGLVAGAPVPVAAAFVAGSAGLAAVLVVLGRRRPGLASGLLVAGAVAWGVGNVLWLAGREMPRVVPWWIGFLVTTIAGERLELSRIRNPPRSASAVLAGIVALLGASLAAGLFWPQPAFRALGLALALLAGWLLVHDLARVGLWKSGVTRFTAVCLLSGFVWLALGGLGALVRGNAGSGLAYDAVLHAIFVGFVFSMIFGHAPIVFPAVLGRPIEFRPVAYLPLALLHASLAFRLGADAVGWPEARLAAAGLNAVAVLGFLVLTAVSVRRGRSVAPPVAS